MKSLVKQMFIMQVLYIKVEIMRPIRIKKFVKIRASVAASLHNNLLWATKFKVTLPHILQANVFAKYVSLQFGS